MYLPSITVLDNQATNLTGDLQLALLPYAMTPPGRDEGLSSQWKGHSAYEDGQADRMTRGTVQSTGWENHANTHWFVIFMIKAFLSLLPI